MIIFSLVIVTILSLLPAILSVAKHDASEDDYLTAKHSIHWLPAGVSAGVSMLSGFSFTALVGYSYTYGLFAIWFVIIRNVGEILITWYMWPKLYQASIKHDCATLSQLAGKILGQNMKYVRLLSGTLIFFLLTLYTSSQLQSAGIALEHTFSVNYVLTISLATIFLLGYCVWGGIRSSIWTDNSQAIFMLITLLSVPIAILFSFETFEALIAAITENSNTQYFQLFEHENIPFEGIYIFSLLFIGFCILGQPHVFSRFITVGNTNSLQKAKITYYVTAFTMNMLAVFSGIAIRGIIAPEQFMNELGSINAESALFVASATLFPLWFVIFIAAGGASAAISTSDSQIQSASSAFVIDVIRPIRALLLSLNALPENDWTHHHLTTKAATIMVILLAAFLAIFFSSQTVFDIVEISWSTQGSLFFGLFAIFYLVRNSNLSQINVLLIMLVGVSGTLTWKFLGLNHIAYPGIFGITLSMILGLALSMKARTNP